LSAMYGNSGRNILSLKKLWWVRILTPLLWVKAAVAVDCTTVVVVRP